MNNQRLTRKQRNIIKRIIVKGTLVLETPTCLASGDAEGATDMMLLRDSITDKALLTGASIAGALRNYVHEYEQGYEQAERNNSLSSLLFGGIRQNDDGEQSPLIIHNSISSEIPQIELRDGVEISTKTGTAADKAKYDLELLAAGTEFPLCFELLIEKDKNEGQFVDYYNQLLRGLIIALQGLENKEISLGLKKRRGFGRCHIDNWDVWEFDLQNELDRKAWLIWDRDWGQQYAKPIQTGKIESIIQSSIQIPDQRDRFTINATFSLASPLLIRSGQATSGRAPDVVHLKSHRDGELKPILSGTSLAGVLRHQAERIVNTLEKPTTIIDGIFGTDFSEDKTKEAKASRLIVHESIINDTTDLVQTRIAIDRFTGGAYHGALFQEQPVFGSGDENLKLEIELRSPEPHEIGLLLLLLKDLWTQDLPVGGSSRVGRGRLQGKEATLTWTKAQKLWKISQPNLRENSLEITGSDRQDLKDYVKKFVE